METQQSAAVEHGRVVSEVEREREREAGGKLSLHVALSLCFFVFCLAAVSPLTAMAGSGRGRALPDARDGCLSAGQGGGSRRWKSKVVVE